MNQEKSYVRLDEGGVYRVANTRVMLDSVVAAFHQGDSPETIKQQYPALTLEEVYGSLAYYLAPSAEVDAYLQRQDAVWEQCRIRSEQRPSPVVERLRAFEPAEDDSLTSDLLESNAAFQAVVTKSEASARKPFVAGSGG